MNFVKKSAKKALSMLLAMALVVGCGFTGLGNFANVAEPVYANSASVTVNATLVDSENFQGIAHPVLAQKLEVENFNLKPFLTGDTTDFEEPTGIKTAHVLVEAVYYSIYGEDPSAADLNVAADSETANAIKEKLDISKNTTYGGLSQNSVYGVEGYSCSVINNAMCDGLYSATVSNNDNVAFYPYNSKNYSYFQVFSASADVAYGYPVITLKLRQNANGYDSSWNPVTNKVEGGAITKLNDISPYTYATTDANGIAGFQIYGASSSAGSESFVLRSDSTGNNPAYLRVSFTFDGDSTVSNLKVSEPTYVPEDTSIATCTLNGTNVKAFTTNGLDYSFVSAANKATLDVTLTHANAVIEDKAIYVNGTKSSAAFPEATGGSVEVPLSNGSSTVSFTVVNGPDSSIYTLHLVKSASATDNAGAVTRVINGIVNATDYPESNYTASWILAKSNAGKTITAAEKKGFLKNVLNNAVDPYQSAGGAAKDAIALTKLGIDATRVPNKNGGEEINLVNKAFADANTISIYDLPYVIMLMDLDVYENTNTNCTRNALIQQVIDTYSGASGWSHDNTYGYDSSAMMLPALVPYYKKAGVGVNGVTAEQCTTVKGYVDAEIAYYSSVQDSASGVMAGNSNTTEVVVSALTAYGINPNTDDRFVKDGKSLIDGILLYESADHRLGYTDKNYNWYATFQGLEAFGNYRSMLAGGKGNHYAFSVSAVAPCTEWPDAKLLTDLLVTPPTKTTYNKGENFDTDGLVVKAVYNGDATTAETLASGYTLSTAHGTALTSEGVVTVTVSYGGMTKTFNIVVNENSSTPYAVDKINIKVQSNKGTVASKNGLVIKAGVTTVMDALKTVLNDAGKTCVIRGGNYVVSIDGLGELDKGANSGWMYNVNNVTVQTSASDCVLKDGDEVLWYYTLDYKKDSRNTGMKGDETTTPATETQTGTASESVEAAATVKDGKATAELKTDDVAGAIAKVEGEKAENKEVVLEIKDTKGADTIEASIPAAAVKDLDKANVDVAIKTEGGNITIPAEAMGNIAAQSGNSDLTVTMENKKADEVAAAAGGAENLTKEAGVTSEALANANIVDVNITAGGKNITSFGGSSIQLYIPLKGNFVVGRSYLGAAISGKSSIQGFIADCVKIANKLYAKVGTGHLTTFVITNEEVKNPFTDVKEGDYFFQPVLWAVNKEVTSGLSDTAFGPNAGCTRAQMVTFLWRAAGKPWASANKHFSDVAEGAYYKEAIEWAVAAGITNGISEDKFNPNGQVTREQLASFIYRYAQSKNQGFTGSWMFHLDYSDAGKISSWANEAMHWCVMKEIVGGTGSGMLSPQGAATRGQIVTMLYRYFSL